jgi:hypothetical protein
VDERVRDGTQIILRRETRNRYQATPKIYTVITAGILDHHTNIDHGLFKKYTFFSVHEVISTLNNSHTNDLKTMHDFQFTVN